MNRRTSQDGFSLIEALVALALTGLVLGALSTVTGQWLPNWARGISSVQDNEKLARGLERIAADLSAAEYVPLSAGANPLFNGSELSVTFVRSALGPNTSPGLEIVQLSETGDRQGLALVRKRARFVPANPGSSPIPQFRDPVVLVRAPYRVSFAYAGDDRHWKPDWRDADRLPRAVRVTVRDSGTQQVLAISTVAAIHVTGAPPCQAADQSNGCEQSAPASDSSDTTRAGANQ